MTFSDPYPGKEGRWWVEVVFDDGHVQPAVFANPEEAQEFIADPGTPTRMQRLRDRLGDGIPDASTGYVPVFRRVPQGEPQPLPSVPISQLPPVNPFRSEEEEADALKKDNELQRLRIENAELRKGVEKGEMPRRLAAKDFISGAIGAVVWAVASRFIGC